METKIKRLERGLAKEEAEDVIDPEVTKMGKDAFDAGVKLAKLVDPTLNGGPKVGVFINGGGAGPTAVTAVTAAELASQAIAELEAQGIQRSDIDRQMVADYIANKGRAAIETTAT
jgi:hypothetical protein